MSFVEQAVEELQVEAEYSRRNRCTSTPPSSFQHIQSRLIRPFPAPATTVNFLLANQSSSQHIHRSKEAARTDLVVNLAEDGQELELEDESCNGTPPLSIFEQHLIRSGSVPAMSPIFHPSHKNDAGNHFNAADNLVVDLGEERGSSSAPFNSSFQLIQQRLVRPSPATQPALVSHHDQSHHDQSSQRSSMEHTVGHFEAHDGALKNLGTLNVGAQKLEEKESELKMVADETDSRTPLSSFQLVQSCLFRSLPGTSAQTIDLPQTNQSLTSHQLAPLSVFQDCLKQSQSVRSISRGDVCRRRLFSKSIDLDEDVTMPVPIASKRARIEDYVDTVLLSEAAQKIRSLCQQELLQSNSLELESNLNRGSSSFDWPTADLQAMTTSTPTDCYSLTTQQKLLTRFYRHLVSVKCVYLLECRGSTTYFMQNLFFDWADTWHLPFLHMWPQTSGMKCHFFL